MFFFIKIQTSGHCRHGTKKRNLIRKLDVFSFRMELFLFHLRLILQCQEIKFYIQVKNVTKRCRSKPTIPKSILKSISINTKIV